MNADVPRIDLLLITEAPDTLAKISNGVNGPFLTLKIHNLVLVE